MSVYQEASVGTAKTPGETSASMKRVGTSALATIAATLAVASTSCSDQAPPPPVDASDEISKVFQADLPSSHSNARVSRQILMTTVVQGCFSLSQSDLDSFLRQSALLPDELNDGNLLSGVTGNLKWWQPNLLENPRGVSSVWADQGLVATCDLAVGKLAGQHDLTVFFMVVYEPRAATGSNPTVLANPNWKPATQPPASTTSPAP